MDIKFLRYIPLLFLWSLVVQCKSDKKKQESKEKVAVDSLNYILNTKSFHKPWELNVEVVPKVEQWKNFQNYKDSFSKIYAIQNREDLHLFIEDLEEKEALFLELGFPTYFDIPQIKSRFIVLKTLRLKIKSNIKDKSISIQNFESDLKEMTIAMNAILRQFEEVLLRSIKEEILDENN